ncbi:hypothetical protein F2Q69_00060416 [Brassica cretica]|uniref:Mitochondrial carrier protein n=1 Tax=Brassica cretica TaxID=69181 RepID=A0A8S9RJ78_BRACR|nr:hypothetical protein F2Q69_00060416 [Brassica cretica]
MGEAENLWVASEIPSSSSSPAETKVLDFPTKDSTTGFEILCPKTVSLPHLEKGSTEDKLGLTERVFSAAGAAFLSAVILNPLDVVKTRLQAQAAGVSYSHPLSYDIGRMAFFGPNMMFADLRCSPSCARAGVQVCYPIELARTRMQAFKEAKAGMKKPPGVLKTLVGVVSEVRTVNNLQNSLHNYRVLWRGLGAQLARDVPFSAICWATLEPMRRRLLGIVGNDTNALGILGANFSAGFVAGTIAAATTCPFDVAKTRRQIEKDPCRAMRMTTRQTLIEVWRDGGMRGLFTGIGPRVARAGPSVGIVISFYEVVKYALHRQYASS